MMLLFPILGNRLTSFVCSNSGTFNVSSHYVSLTLRFDEPLIPEKDGYCLAICASLMKVLSFIMEKLSRSYTRRFVLD